MIIHIFRLAAIFSLINFVFLIGLSTPNQKPSGDGLKSASAERELTPYEMPSEAEEFYRLKRLPR